MLGDVNKNGWEVGTDMGGQFYMCWECKQTHIWSVNSYGWEAQTYMDWNSEDRALTTAFMLPDELLGILWAMASQLLALIG